MRTSFRFEKMGVWQRAARLTGPLFDLATELEQQRKFRFCEQLWGATLSVTNNMAEGSGAVSNKEFAHFLSIARRSIFEVANILLMLELDRLVTSEQIDPWLVELEEISRMTESFRQTLANKDA